MNSRYLLKCKWARDNIGLVGCNDEEKGGDIEPILNVGRIARWVVSCGVRVEY